MRRAGGWGDSCSALHTETICWGSHRHCSRSTGWFSRHSSLPSIYRPDCSPLLHPSRSHTWGCWSSFQFGGRLPCRRSSFLLPWAGVPTPFGRHPLPRSAHLLFDIPYHVRHIYAGSVQLMGEPPPTPPFFSPSPLVAFTTVVSSLLGSFSFLFGNFPLLFGNFSVWFGNFSFWLGNCSFWFGNFSLWFGNCSFWFGNCAFWFGNFILVPRGLRHPAVVFTAFDTLASHPGHLCSSRSAGSRSQRLHAFTTLDTLVWFLLIMVRNAGLHYLSSSWSSRFVFPSTASRCCTSSTRCIPASVRSPRYRRLRAFTSCDTLFFSSDHGLHLPAARRVSNRVVTVTAIFATSTTLLFLHLDCFIRLFRHPPSHLDRIPFGTPGFFNLMAGTLVCAIASISTLVFVIRQSAP